MKRYQIDIWMGIGFFCTEVEAENEEEAKQLAWEEVQDMTVSQMNIKGSEEYKICKEEFICDECGSYQNESDIHFYNGKCLCESCYDELTENV